MFASRGRRALGVLSKVASRRFAFAFVTAAVIAAKVIHILAHQRAFSRRNLLFWTLSFLTQDYILLISLRYLSEWVHNLPRKNGLRRALAKVALSAAIVFSATVSIVNITFYACSRSEMRWRNVDFAKDKSSRGVLLSGLASFIGIMLALIGLAWLLQDLLYSYAGIAIDVVNWPMGCLRPRKGAAVPDLDDDYDYQYTKLSLLSQPQNPAPIDTESRKQDFISSLSLVGVRSKSKGNTIYKICRGVWTAVALIEIVSFLLRPMEGSYIYMSWTTPVIPFVDFKDSVSNLQGLQPVYGTGINRAWDNITAIDKPIPLKWLPKENILKGFEDWYGPDQHHYNSAADPLFISNLEQDVLAQVKDSLDDMSIKHIVLVVMESTRKDLFPIKKDGLVWNRFAKESPGGNLTDEAAERLRTLTSTANFLTGDYDDGFVHDGNLKRRGGLNFRDAYTAATYTRKSMVGTLCGVWPLVADFNMEHMHHIYQPCLPQILEAFNYLDQQDEKEKNAPKWQSHYLQSVSLNYDHADVSTEQFGFPADNIIGSKYLRSPSAKFGQVNLPNVNYFGMVEEPLLDYVKDAFSSAKEKNERVFMTHLTSTTHHPYNLPADETYVPLANGRLNAMSHYINTIGYDDRWIGKLLNSLEEEGVADETLVVLTGDHGLSLPENDKPASYYNPNVGCNHVPMVISHPKLPPIDIADSVSATDLLPTILDLLRESGSISKSASSAAGDLLANYEGQSLIRKLSDPKSPEEDEAVSGLPSTMGNWQFVVMNPGRAMLGVRDRLQPHWRLVVPVIQNVEWKFTDLKTDPTDMNGVQAFDFAQLIARVEEEHGRPAAVWAEEAAFVTRWWVEENNKRWQYGVYEPKRLKNKS